MESIKTNINFNNNKINYNNNSTLKTTSTSSNNKVTDVLELDTNVKLNNSGKLDYNQIDFSKISSGRDDALNGNFFSEDSLLTEYWKGDLTYSKDNNGIVAIYKGDTLMGFTQEKYLKNNNRVSNKDNTKVEEVKVDKDDAYNKVKNSMTDKVVNGVTYGGAGNASNFAITGRYSDGVNSLPKDDKINIEPIKTEVNTNTISNNNTRPWYDILGNIEDGSKIIGKWIGEKYSSESLYNSRLESMKESKIDYIKVYDESNDKYHGDKGILGMFGEYTTLFDDSHEIEYTKKEKLSDGTVIYYDGDSIVKKLLPDKTVELYKEYWVERKFQNNIDDFFKNGSYKIVLSPNGEKSYYDKYNNLRALDSSLGTTVYNYDENYKNNLSKPYDNISLKSIKYPDGSIQYIPHKNYINGELVSQQFSSGIMAMYKDGWSYDNGILVYEELDGIDKGDIKKYDEKGRLIYEFHKFGHKEYWYDENKKVIRRKIGDTEEWLDDNEIVIKKIVTSVVDVNGTTCKEIYDENNKLTYRKIGDHETWFDGNERLMHEKDNGIETWYDRDDNGIVYHNKKIYEDGGVSERWFEHNSNGELTYIKTLNETGSIEEEWYDKYNKELPFSNIPSHTKRIREDEITECWYDENYHLKEMHKDSYYENHKIKSKYIEKGPIRELYEYHKNGVMSHYRLINSISVEKEIYQDEFGNEIYK